MRLFNIHLILASSATSLASTTAECFKDCPFHKNDWTYCQPINHALFMYYTPLGDTVMLGLHATEGVMGWSSLSLSGNGGMKGASQIIVRRDDTTDEWIAEDRYSFDYAPPILDESQDVQLLFAEQDEETGETAWGVVIPQNSCDDPYDYDVDDHRSFMLWAFGDSHSFNFHGSGRGQFLANLLAPPADEVDFDDYDHLSLTMNNVKVVRGEPELDPTNPFICTYFDLDHLGKEFDFTSKDELHMVGYDTTASPGSEKYLHHMVLFECDGDGDDATTDTRRDLGDNFLFHGKVIESCTAMPPGCQQPVATWAVGAGANVLPKDVGISIGEGNRWLVLQMHYYKPTLDEDVYDSSGLNLFFTKDLRPIEGGVMFFSAGAQTGQHPPLPGGQKDVTMETLYVEPDCSSQWKEPLTIMSVHHHSHFMGTYQELIVERDGKNMGPLRKEHAYDYNHQAGVEPQAKLSQLLPGDRIATTCHFDTRSVSSSDVVEIGEESNREMCVPFLYYYPKQEQEFFAYYPTEVAAGFMTLIDDYAWCSMSPTEEEGAFGSMCVEKLYSNVVHFANRTFALFGYDGPSFTYSQLCNGGNKTSGLRESLEICPAECAERSCTSKELIEGAKGVCEYACGSLGLSLYPDASHKELFQTANLPCPTPFFDPPTIAEPEKCKAKGSLPVDITLNDEESEAKKEHATEDGQKSDDGLIEAGVVEVEVDSGSSSLLASSAAMLSVVAFAILM